MRQTDPDRGRILPNASRAKENSGMTLGANRLTLSTSTMCIHPSIVKYGIRLPGLRQIDAAPNGDRGEKWLRLDANSSGYASIRVSAREPNSVGTSLMNPGDDRRQIVGIVGDDFRAADFLQQKTRALVVCRSGNERELLEAEPIGNG
jgi:hypothetical protein